MLPLQLLLVEDHEDSAVSLARILTKQGHSVTVSASLTDARAHAAGRRFDVMLCDLGLPDGDGCDLMKEFSTKYPFPGVALTGFGMPEDIDRAMNAGFATHVLKPIAIDKLLAVLADVMQSRVVPRQDLPNRQIPQNP